MIRAVSASALLATLATLSSCSTSTVTDCSPGEIRCLGNRSEQCNDDGTEFVLLEDCAASSLVCVVPGGCKTCTPDSRSCDGFDIVRCRPDGSGSDPIATCEAEAGDVCFGGNCINACTLAEQNRSYEGCEYWAVDLDNAVVANQGTAAAQQFSVVLSNASALTADITFEIYCTPEDAMNPAIGCTVDEPHVIEQFPLAPGGLKIVDLDPRELDGTSNPSLNDGPGTFISKHAFRITSTAPLIAYQFNPLENVNVFSNDASLLLPTSALDSRYLVLSWPQTLALTQQAETNGGIDLRAFLTIVGLEDDTELVIHLTTDILPGPGVPAMKAGETLLLSVDRFEVINLETDGFNADFTGTELFVDSPTPAPIAVFTGSEASDSPFFESLIERSCCADHLEQQLFPESALGVSFVAVKTPLRTKYVEEAGWDVALVPDEPEYWRILATKEDTYVNTNLPPPNDEFFLGRGQSVMFESERDFTVVASRPISFGQFPASQQTTGIPPSTIGDPERIPGGDPSFILVPPIEQWRSSYLFLVPNKYAFDFLLIAAPTSAEILYDGLFLDSVLTCEYEPIGFIDPPDADPIEYQAIRCPLSQPAPMGGGFQDDGVHLIESIGGEPVGLIVYGWDSFVSYGYPGGTNVELINLQ